MSESQNFEYLHDGYLFGTFKNYRLKKKLGEGGMGQTWLAEELVENEVRQRVVLKILTRELRGNADAMKEVWRVFDLTINLYHSSICPLLGWHVDPKFGDFLVMKYADGGTLADWFKAQPGHENGLPLETLLPIFGPLAAALDYAHRNGILHRNVKPQNIMFMGREKTPVLINFGIAARIRPEDVTSNTQSFSRTDTMAHSSSGTPRYMAPEQMEGKSQNGRTDQYALATVLYEMLTGSLPFSGNSIMAIFRQKLYFVPRSDDFAQNVNDALTRAFAVNDKDRFASCAEFIAALTGEPGNSESEIEDLKKALEEERRRFEEERRRWEEERNAQPVREPEQKASKPRVNMAELKETLRDRGFEYEIDGDSITITEYTGSASSVTIPDGVTSIGNEAFWDCRSLTSVTIPDSVTSIGGGPFAGCEKLTKILVSVGNTHFKTVDGILFSADGKTLIQVPAGKGLTEYTIPDSVTSIGEDAFFGCESLTSVTIPDSVTSIGGGPFAACDQLTEIRVSAGNTHFKSVDGILFTADGKTLIQFPKGKDLTEYTIPNSVTSIGVSAFSSCYRLTSVTIPDSVTSIGNEAFSWCNSLTSVTIPNSVTSIGNYAFRSCYSLTSVTIPDSVTSIGEGAFSFCNSLTSVTIPESVASIGGGPFAACDQLTEISVSAGNTHFKSEDGILFTADGKTLIQFPKGKDLTEYTIPDSVTSIGNEAFSWCESLTSVTIPDSVTSIGSSAFSDCKSLTSVTIPNSVTSIGNYAFSYCLSFTSVTIPDSVTSIGDSAFFYCPSLTSVTIPDSVTSIGIGVFSFCDSLTSVTIPDSVTSIGNYAFSHCKSLTSVTIPDSVTSIGNCAFEYCHSLTSVTIPDSVTSIGDSAFRGCESLTIYGEVGSEAERYAKKEGIDFEAE